MSYPQYKAALEEMMLGLGLPLPTGNVKPTDAFQMGRKFTARITELEAQLEAAKKDAERYQWLIKSHWYIGPEPEGDLQAVSWNNKNNTEAGVTQAIDAAIAEGKA